MQELASGELDPMGSDIGFDDIVIRSPGVSGSVTVFKPTPGESRGQTLGSEALGAALDSHDVDTDYYIEIGDVGEQPSDAAVSTRSMAPDHKGIEIRLPAAGETRGQLLLMTDENGIASWHLPVDERGAAEATRGRDTAAFIVPGYPADMTGEGNPRGVLGWFGKKVIRVLSFALDDSIGVVGDFFASRWERKNRPYVLRRITSETYRENGTGELTAADWQSLGTGRSLLLVHGTFSRAATAFCELPPEFIDELNARYQGRVFAFDHVTLSEDPTDNARFFANSMPPGQVLDVDIVCHSRGGHVARILTELQEDLPLNGKTLAVGQIVFVASPNRGTVLTDPKYMGDFIDAHTNILSALPDNAVTDALEVIVAVAKQMAVGTLKGLEGLQSMNPAGAYVNNYLNKGAPVAAKYRSIAGSFEPTDGKLKPWAKDRLMDHIFKEANDLVVPTLGVYEHNGDPMFPITEDSRLDLNDADGVHHGSFFGNAKVIEQLGEWLKG